MAKDVNKPGKPCGDAWIADGNVCHVGEGKAAQGPNISEIAPLPKNSFVDVSNWPKHNTSSIWAAKKIAYIEGLHHAGKLDEIKALDTIPKSNKPNKYQKGLHQAHKQILALHFSQHKKVEPEAPESHQEPTQTFPPLPKFEGTEVVKASSGGANGGYFPAKDVVNVSQWTKVGGQLGSNPGGVYKDIMGNKWYVKESKSNDHALNEMLAAKLYEAAGSPILKYHLADFGNGKLGTATPWVDGKVDFDPHSKVSIDVARRNFATHAWLSNYDAIGLANDNQAGIKGVLTTLDVGGALKYRAQGKLKEDFGNDVGEWESMRSIAKNSQSAFVFGGMSPKELIDSGKKVINVPDETISSLVARWGTDGHKTEMANKIIARKYDIAKRMSDESIKQSKTSNVTNPPASPIIPKPVQSRPFLPVPQGYIEEKNPIKSSVLYHLAVQKNITGLKSYQAAHGTLLDEYRHSLIKAVEAGHIPHPENALPSMDEAWKQSGATGKPSDAHFGVYAAAKHGIDTFGHIKPTYSQSIIFKTHLEKLVGDLKAKGEYKTAAAPELKAEQVPLVLPPKSTPVEPISEPPKPKAEEKSIPAPNLYSTGTNPWVQPKINSIYEAAKTGDVEKVKAIETSPTTKNTYGKKIHAYKMSVIAAMEGGAKTIGVGEVVPKVVVHPKANLKLTDLPPDPVFTSKQTANVESNKLAVQKYKEKYLEGDLPYFQALPPHPSNLLTSWKGVVVSTLKDKLFPPTPPKSFGGQIAELKIHADILKVSEAKDKVGYFLVVGNPGVIEHEYGHGKELPASGPWVSPHNAAFLKLNSDEQQYIKSYTGSAYSSMNPAFWQGNLSNKEKVAGNGIMKSSQKIPEGSLIYRNLTLNEGQLKELKNAVGKVLQEPAIMSSSVSSHVWNRNVKIHMIAGPGVRGLYINPNSKNKGENEMIFPPNTRILIQKVTQGTGVTKVDAILLPTEDKQCC